MESLGVFLKVPPLMLATIFENVSITCGISTRFKKAPYVKKNISY